MRYELKILFSPGAQSEILHRLASSSWMLREIYHQRQVNNIYFDTLEYSDYLASVNGRDFRKKFRLRWYGPLYGPADPTLEMKYKRGWEGGKHSCPLPSFFLETLDIHPYFQDLRQKLPQFSPEDQAVLGELLSRNPVLVNCYQRRYFLSANEKFRLTLDEEMSFYDYFHCQNQGGPVSQDPKVLLEVKFDPQDYPEAILLLDELQYRVHKNSKYVNGMESVLYHNHPLPF